VFDRLQDTRISGKLIELRADQARGGRREDRDSRDDRHLRDERPPRKPRHS
jgi:ATP-dependent RNA helicase DeaD